MASFEGFCLTEFMRKHSNFNPVRHPQIIRKFERLNRIAVKPEYCPKEFCLYAGQTEAGTKFELFRKKRETITGMYPKEIKSEIKSGIETGIKPESKKSRGEENTRDYRTEKAEKAADRTAATGNKKLVLYFHGGAYLAGLFFFYKDFVPDFYRESGGADVMFLDYSLAPAHQYPFQLNEALDLWKDVTEKQGYSPEHIVLGGDSAGANLVLALMLRLRDDGKKLPKGAFCISVWGDMTGNSESFSFNYGKDVEFGEIGKKLTKQTRDLLHNSEIYAWLGAEADRYNPYISPVLAEYHQFPPMVFTASSHEMLLCDTLTIVRKCKELHIPVKCDIQPEMFHIYPVFRHMSPESSHSYWMILKFIRQMLQE